MSGKQIVCSICKKSVPSSQGWSRWGDDFCSKECHDVRFAVEKEKMAEKEKREAAKPSYRWSSCDTGGGNAF